MEAEQLPIPKVLGWQALYEPNARVKCIRDNPPMHGFGREIKAGEIISIDSVTWRGKYEVGVKAECAFYQLEGYFEVELPSSSQESSVT